MSIARAQRAAERPAVSVPTPPKRSWWRRRLVQWTPYVITIVVIIAIVREYSWSEISGYVQLGSVWPLLPIGLFSAVATLLLVATADRMVVTGCCEDVSWPSVVRAKAGSSLLDVFGYVAGHGVYAVWIARFTGTRAALAGGAMLYIAASDLLSISTVAAVSMFFAGAGVPQALHIVATCVAIALAMFIVTGRYELLGRGISVFKPWAEIPRTTGFAQTGIRIIHVIVWVLVTWTAARLFGLPIPLSAMATYLPIIMLVGSLPINVAGFGAVQGVWLIFFTDYAPGAQIFAFQCIWSLIVVGGVLVRGLPFVKRVITEMDRGKPCE